MPARYTYVWEFQVLPENEALFAYHYGPEGSWAKLFRRAPGYVETRLLKDRAMPGRYVTVDRWENAAAFESFREHFGEAYMELDRSCDKLTVDERSLGAFEEAYTPRR
jgi:heme-degrading monooxygenase HmoA